MTTNRMFFVCMAYLPYMYAAASAAELTIARIAAYDDPATFIRLVPPDELRASAAAIDPNLPLAGMTFAVKDNIDVVGIPTTAACPAFAYTPDRSATVVDRLLAAGALFVGKTNMDQFATGLVGTRSPHGTPRNPLAPQYIPGGSSAGSAVSVAAGMVTFALGTDTAGSGRIPAGFTGTVGVKPTRGIVSAAGVVPASRTIDCVSIFANDVTTAMRVLDVAAAFDARDPLSRERRDETQPTDIRIAVPMSDQLFFDGDAESGLLFRDALDRLEKLTAARVEMDFQPCLDAAALLYGDAFVAERLAAVGDFIGSRPDDVLLVTRTIIEDGARFSAADAFRAIEKLDILRAAVRGLWTRADVLVVPTAPRTYSLADIEAEPYAYNRTLGTYTNFVNFFDWSAIAIPSGRTRAGVPVGITLIGPAFAERRLAELARRYSETVDPSGTAAAYQSGFRRPSSNARRPER